MPLMANGSTPAVVDSPGRIEPVDFESFHISSRPVSRRASPIPLTPVTTSNHPSDLESRPEYSGADRSDCSESNRGSNAAHGPRSQRIEIIETFDSLQNPRGANVAIIPPRTTLGLPQRTPSLPSATSGSYDNAYVQRATLAAAKTGDDDVGSAIHSIPGVNSQSTDAWNACVTALRNYDERMVRGWKEDVDSLLVFSGLFSAVVTTFNVEAYKFLQEDPQATSVNLLKQISSQLSTTPEPASTSTTSSSSFRPDSRSIRINILWFSSLVFSLVSASIGILTKQWLREYISDAASSARENARIRQLRYEGFVRWRIPLTIALLPILLQIALALFFVGLLDLLWSLDAVVAGVVTGIVTISLSFLVVTTIMPTIRDDCPYKSPQALGIFLVCQGLGHLFSLAAVKLNSWFGWNRRAWPLYLDASLFNRRRRRLAGWLQGFIHRKQMTSWRDREKYVVREIGEKLDRHILSGADETFMDDEFLKRTLRACLNDTACVPAIECLHKIIVHRADRIEDGVPRWKYSDEADGGVNLLLHLVVDILPRMDPGDDTSIVKVLAIAGHLCRAIPFETGHPDTSDLYQRLFENLARFLTHNRPVQQCSFDLMRNVWYRSSAPVQPSVIKSLANFACSAKAANELSTFQLACEMALAFSTAPNLPNVAFNNVRVELATILDALEQHLAVPSTPAAAPSTPTAANGAILTVSSEPTPAAPPDEQSALLGQSASLLLGLEQLAALDPDLLTPGLLRILDRVRLDDAAAADDASVASVLRRQLASARALRRLRLRRGPRAQRRNAIDVRGADDIAALNLRLPKTPERRAGDVSPASRLGPGTSPRTKDVSGGGPLQEGVAKGGGGLGMEETADSTAGGGGTGSPPMQVASSCLRGGTNGSPVCSRHPNIAFIAGHGTDGAISAPSDLTCHSPTTLSPLPETFTPAGLYSPSSPDAKIP